MLSSGVLSVVARGKHLLVAAGSEVCCHDLLTGQLIRKFQDLHDESKVIAVEGTQNSEMLFTAAGEGLVMAHDLRMKNGSRLIWHHNAGTRTIPLRWARQGWHTDSLNASKFLDPGVQSLSFDDPWLASASSNGSVLLIDVDAQLRGGGGGSSRNPSGGPPCHKHLHTHAGPAYAVDIADGRVVCGSESDSVRVWDFTGAGAAAERSASAKAGRNARKCSKRCSSSSAVRRLEHNVKHEPVADQFLLGTSPPTLPPIIESMEHQQHQASAGRRAKWWANHARAAKRSGRQDHDCQVFKVVQ